MNKLERVLRNLFRSESNAKSDLPFVHENIDAPLIDEDSLQVWKLSDHSFDLFEKILRQFSSFENDLPLVDQSIQFVKQSGVFGFIIHCQDFDHLEHSDYLHLLEYLKEEAQDEGYVKKLGDVQSRNRGTTIEKSIRYYLKPSLRLSMGQKKANQLYGNITLILLQKNGKDQYVKVMFNHYVDRQYQDVLPYSQLMNNWFAK
jgi:hypothetical protein